MGIVNIVLDNGNEGQKRLINVENLTWGRENEIKIYYFEVT